MTVIWFDWRGIAYAFCSYPCQQAYKGWVTDPAAPAPPLPAALPTYACCWCGGDLAEGVAFHLTGAEEPG